MARFPRFLVGFPTVDRGWDDPGSPTTCLETAKQCSSAVEDPGQRKDTGHREEATQGWILPWLLINHGVLGRRQSLGLRPQLHAEWEMVRPPSGRDRLEEAHSTQSGVSWARVIAESVVTVVCGHLPGMPEALVFNTLNSESLTLTSPSQVSSVVLPACPPVSIATATRRLRPLSPSPLHAEAGDGF